MDPNANLEEQRTLIAALFACQDQDHDLDPCECFDNGLKLAELAYVLDEWIRKGGFLPDAWGSRRSRA